MSVHSQPLVSIVTPSFNQGRFLEQTIRSVLNQTYAQIEYLVLDGGSNDESVEIIRRYESRLAYWHSRPDDGFSDAIRQGFDRSNGQILAYLNSDDLLAPNAVEVAVKRLQKSKAAIMVYGNRVCLDERGRLLYYRPALPIWANSPWVSVIVGQESCFWRRDAYDAVGGVNTSRKFAIDYDLFAKLSRQGEIVWDRRLWGFFRKHAHSKTITQYRTLGKAEVKLIQIEVWGGQIPRLTWLLGVFLCRFYAMLAMLFVPKPKWPESLHDKRRVSLPEMLYLSSHEGSFLRKSLHWIRYNDL